MPNLRAELRVHRVRTALILAGFAGALLAPACSAESETRRSSGGSPPDGGGGIGGVAPNPASSTGGGGSGGDGASGGGGCVLESLPIIVEREGGVATDLHAVIGYSGAKAALLIDTGSDATFLQEPLGTPDPTPNAATFQLGCLDLEVIGRPTVALQAVTGIPTVGFLGTDLLTRGPTFFDLNGANIHFHPSNQPFSNAAAWPASPYDFLSGAVVTRVTLDGQAVRLIVDTGAQNTVWVGQDGQPGDTEIMMEDAYGDIFPGYVGTTELEIGGKTQTVPVTRVPMFPQYEPPAPDVVGLIGISSLGAGFVFDPDASLLRVDF